FLHFSALIQNQFKSSIKTFQCDGGGEFMALKPIFLQKGILFYISCPYTPEPNGWLNANTDTLSRLDSPYLLNQTFLFPFGMKPLLLVLTLSTEHPTKSLIISLPLKPFITNNQITMTLDPLVVFVIPYSNLTTNI
ncbi:Unknown protein, partial [Striga hermonthica]